jgi:hypothetical protein
LRCMLITLIFIDGRYMSQPYLIHDCNALSTSNIEIN